MAPSLTLGAPLASADSHFSGNGDKPKSLEKALGQGKGLNWVVLFVAYGRAVKVIKKNQDQKGIRVIGNIPWSAPWEDANNGMWLCVARTLLGYWVEVPLQISVVLKG